MMFAYLNSGKNIPPELHAWAKRLVDDLNLAIDEVRGRIDALEAANQLDQYTDDTAAAAGGVEIGGEYYDDDGVRRRRIV